jgi:hypothetical protein
MNCAVCGRPATIHVCETDGQARVSRSYCEAHLPDFASAVVGDGGAIAHQFANELRGIIEYAKQHQRIPDSTECANLGLNAAVLPLLDSGDVSFTTALDYLERLVQFVDCHGRFPEDTEPPFDPWLNAQSL